jgi:hypothetical protein
MILHDCLIDPCPICAIDRRLDFPTDTPWRGDQRELKQTVKHLKILRGESGPDVDSGPAAAPHQRSDTTCSPSGCERDQTSPQYIPPTGSDYICY